MQAWATQELGKLPSEIQEKYRITAFLMNRPQGINLELDEKDELKRRLTRQLNETAIALEELCDVVHLCYLVDMDEEGMKPQVYNSPRLGEVMAKHVQGGVIASIISKKYFKVKPKQLTPRQKYIEIMNELVLDSKFMRIAHKSRLRNNGVGFDGLREVRRRRLSFLDPWVAREILQKTSAAAQTGSFEQRIFRLRCGCPRRATR